MSTHGDAGTSDRASATTGDRVPASAELAPRNLIVVLLDSLNRHMLGAYGGDEFDTPNLDAFARRAVRFNRHYSASLPCMPARHDLLCGSHDFLWKPWGPLEYWEEPVTRLLRHAGVVTQLVTDHYHLFEAGAENYHTDFLGWEFIRGLESDPWMTEPATPDGTTTTVRLRHLVYERNRTRFVKEEEYPCPQTMSAAVEWLERNAGRHDRWFLLVDEFDPHEPFDTPEPYRSMYDPDWGGEPEIWPPYTVKQVPDRKARQIRAQYGGKLTMTDHHFGRLVAALDRLDAWKDTMVIVLTDHGHYLGEHDYWGKPTAPVREELAHIPMFVAGAGLEAGERDALTCMLDVHATIVDAFGLEPERPFYGRSLLPLLRGETDRIRNWVLGGYFARPPYVTDGRRSYQRGWRRRDVPLHVYSTQLAGPPFMPDLPQLVKLSGAEMGSWIPGVDAPTLRFPMRRNIRVRHAPGGEQIVEDAPPDAAPRGRWADADYLFDLTEDPNEDRNVADRDGLRAEMDDVLRAALGEAGAPPELSERLRL